MNMIKSDIIDMLSSKDDKSAYAFSEQIISDSGKSDKWYAFFDDFASLLSHPKSLVRNRALNILAANAVWDVENRFDSILPEYLSHIIDEKPVTSRQCIKALAVVGQAKPLLIPEIISALQNAEFSKYRDSMRPLIEKDIAETIGILEMINGLQSQSP